MLVDTLVKTPLPVRNGVAPSYVWLPAGQWPTIIAFLIERFPRVAASVWTDRLQRGEIADETGQRLHAESPYRSGRCLFYYREVAEETPIPFEEDILHQDEHLLVVDKPHFLPVIPSGRFLQQTLLVRLRKRTGLPDLTPIHRLDRETAGVIIFSVNPASRGQYQSLFQQRAMIKMYEAMAPALHHLKFPLTYHSRLENGEPFFRTREMPGQPNSTTIIDILEEQGPLMRYRLQPLTGRKHQLRVHLASLGAPILNDAFYPLALPCKGDDMTRPLQLLARSVSFPDPLTGKIRYFASNRKLGE